MIFFVAQVFVKWRFRLSQEWKIVWQNRHWTFLEWCPSACGAKHDFLASRTWVTAVGCRIVDVAIVWTTSSFTSLPGENKVDGLSPASSDDFQMSWESKWLLKLFGTEAYRVIRVQVSASLDTKYFGPRSFFCRGMDFFETDKFIFCNDGFSE